MESSNKPIKSRFAAYIERTAFGVLPIAIGFTSITSGLKYNDTKDIALGAVLCLTGFYAYLMHGKKIDLNKKIQYLNETIDELDALNGQLENILMENKIDPKKEVHPKVLDLEVKE